MIQSSRPRRNRSSQSIRNLVQETHISLDKLIYPLFILPEPEARIPIDSMPGIFRLGEYEIMKEIAACLDLGINSYILFPVVPDNLKDPIASYSYAEDNFYLSVIRKIKAGFPDICIITDVAMDPYSSDGHDGRVIGGKIDNEATLPILARMALAQAQAGADIVGPSDMMDGRVAFIRNALDQAGYLHTAIMSYTAKYAGGFYGPFRDALDSAPKFGDKKTYQMNPANRREALREALLDQAEGADYLMVKPALPYLDIISDLRQHTQLPIVAYQVSGEYAMIKAASANGWLNEDALIQETLTSIFRAGADIVITYFGRQYAEIKLANHYHS